MRAPGADRATRSFETPRPITLSLELTHAVVRVIAGAAGASVVTVNPCGGRRSADADAAGRIEVDLAGGTLTIRDPRRRGLAGHLGLGRSGCVDVTVEVPVGSAVRADIGLGDLRCDGRMGDVDLRTGAGSLRLDRTGAVRARSGVGQVALEHASGPVEIVTSGDIDLGTVSGDADIKNLNGATRMTRVEGDVRVKAANGGVMVGDAGRDVTVTTSNGDIRLGRIVRGSTSLETAYGGLEIGISPGTAAWIDATTRFGQVHNTLSPVEDPGGASETVQVRARTAFGDVLITRPTP